MIKMFICGKGTANYNNREYDLPSSLINQARVLKDKEIGDPKVQELFEKILLHIGELENQNS
jgi:hypothetical protein